MDKDDDQLQSYSRVSPLEMDEEEEEGIGPLEKVVIRQTHNEDHNRFLKTLLPDAGISIRGHLVVDGEFTVKLLKFLAFTFGFIALFHIIVASVPLLADRDKNLKLWHIWRYEGNLIVFDSVVFFLVGRLWKQRGVDHLGWIIPMLIANVYYESQHFISWLRHSVTLYEMHCIWPWELWMFVVILVPTIGGVVLAHVWRAYKKKLLVLKISELFLCALFFLVPMLGSNYFHLHHWYAGWLIGMHCNFDRWWSRAAMAYCWGMYINGIAVYGRDPVLTCEYAYWLSTDNRCPYMKCYLEAMEHKNDTATNVVEMIAADWRNCSATGFHP
ncbi:MAG: hypothetical protein SGBAC_012937 [Bacillariaceae sp.]